MSDDKKSAKEFLAEANAQIAQMSAADAVSLLEDGNIVFVDVRETGEVEQGIIPGAEHAPRGMLEFIVDPEGPAHSDVFAQDKKFVSTAAVEGVQHLPALPPGAWG